jgi:hypothetical protein
VPERAYSDADIDAAVGSLSDPQRLRAAQDLVVRIAPQLQQVLAEALESGGWFSEAHEAEVRRATDEADEEERSRLVRTLIAEETRMGMMVGVAVGFELANELQRTNPED